MRIAQISPVIERVPPRKYGGTERVVYTLTEELVKRGHEVTLFATGDSATNARLVSTSPRPLRETLHGKFYERYLDTSAHIGVAYRMQNEFDIIHDHCSANSLPLATIAKTPVVMTLHGAFNERNRKLYETLNNQDNPHFVSISNSQREPIPHLNYAGTVYNGLNMKHYPFSNRNNGYLLFVGRIAMEKGVHTAIKVARRLDLPLIIAAKLEKINERYYEKYIRPYLSDKIRHIGEVNEKDRNILMSKALCFLHPVTWREPFGLTLIETMATGCPVVAFNKGSIPEVVKNNKTGFVVETVNEMTKAIKQINSIDRSYCRSYALTNFSAEKMTDDYEKVYKKILLLNDRKKSYQINKANAVTIENRNFWSGARKN